MRGKSTNVPIESLKGARATASLKKGEIFIEFNTMKGYTFAFDLKDPEHFDLIIPTDRSGQAPRIRGEIASVEGLDEHLQQALLTTIAS